MSTNRISKISPLHSHWAANLDIPPKNWYLDTLDSVATDGGNIYDGCWHIKARTIILEPPNKFSPHASKECLVSFWYANEPEVGVCNFCYPSSSPPRKHTSNQMKILNLEVIAYLRRTPSSISLHSSSMHCRTEYQNKVFPIYIFTKKNFPLSSWRYRDCWRSNKFPFPHKSSVQKYTLYM